MTIAVLKAFAKLKHIDFYSFCRISKTISNIVEKFYTQVS